MDLKDFEVFKEHFELFSKIDTPEKLEICKKQYERYLTDLESADYFEPETEKNHSGISWKYDDALRQLLQTENIREKEFYLLVKPSFDPEWLLIFSQKEASFSLELKELENIYWDKIYSHETEVPRMIIKQNELPHSLATSVYRILSRSMDDAKKMPGGYHVIDGVKYFLSRRLKDEIQTVSKHSPDVNSVTGKVISMMNLLADYAKSREIIKQEEIQKELELLISQF